MGLHPLFRASGGDLPVRMDAQGDSEAGAPRGRAAREDQRLRARVRVTTRGMWVDQGRLLARLHQVRQQTGRRTQLLQGAEE